MKVRMQTSHQVSFRRVIADTFKNEGVSIYGNSNNIDIGFLQRDGFSFSYSAIDKLDSFLKLWTSQEIDGRPAQSGEYLCLKYSCWNVCRIYQ